MSQDAPHILVTGDAWQYVPFGRARIKALRATGLNYASQTFTMPDGAAIKVRIAGEQSFISISGGSSLYMESGQLEWSYPAEANPDRNEPAKWHFMDIGTGGDYLGKIASGGAQANDPALAENQDSLAIGYPKSKTGTPEEIAAADAKAALDYSDATIMKKMVAATFPASLFTGKMRLFMQSQYGAKEALKSRLELRLVGTSPALYYKVGDKELQFGFWGHGTPGIFTDPDGKYWLLNITTVGSNALVTSYPLAAASGLLGSIKKLSGEEKTKAEAYLFANSTFDLTKPVVVGMHLLPVGGAMAYGWKFNKTGDKASIVLNEAINVGVNRRYRSSTVHLTFTVADGKVAVSGTAMDSGEWVDGWGVFNIFVPNTETVTAPLSLYSQSAGSPKATQFSFSNVPIYGYYVDDVWTPVKMSTDTTTPSPTKVIYRNNIYVTPIAQSEIVLCGSSWSKAIIEAFSGSSSTISVGGYSYTGESRVGTITEVVATTTDAPSHGPWTNIAVDPGSVVTANFWYCPAVGTGAGEYVSMGLSSPPGLAEIIAAANIYIPLRGGPYPASAPYIERTLLPQSRATTTGNGTACTAWALVIPGGDCEAAYVAKSEYFAYTGAGTVTTQEGLVMGPDATWGWGGSPSETFIAFAYMWQEVGTWGAFVSVSSTVVTSGGTGKQTYSVKCFNSAVSAAEGTPGGGYYALFNCAYTYPYYDRGMYTYTSHGKRYVMSEGLKSPSSAYYDRRFVGWA